MVTDYRFVDALFYLFLITGGKNSEDFSAPVPSAAARREVTGRSKWNSAWLMAAEMIEQILIKSAFYLVPHLGRGVDRENTYSWSGLSQSCCQFRAQISPSEVTQHLPPWILCSAMRPQSQMKRWHARNVTWSNILCSSNNIHRYRVKWAGAVLLLSVVTCPEGNRKNK